MMDRLLRPLLVLAIAFSVAADSSSTGSSLGIPGTASTISGYDTEQGQDPICWLSREAMADGTASANTSVEFPSVLVDGFRIGGEVNLLQACPTGISLTVSKPELFEDENFVPRTQKRYNYTLHAEIDLDQLEGDALMSDTGKEILAVQILVCELGKAGFCSPFVHEQANAREAREGIAREDGQEGDRHGGSHVHSKYVFVDTTEHRVSEAQQHLISFSQVVPMVVNDPGSFFVIGAIQMFVSNVSYVRYDISNALQPNPLVTYQEPPEMLTVRQGIEWVVWVIIGIACWIILMLFIETYRHRNHQVMQLSQGRFLLVFLVAAFWATACCFLLNPKNDTYCRISAPMIIIPAQLVYAITIGRLWRINRVISPLLLNHYQQAQAMGAMSTSSSRRAGSTNGCQRAMRAVWRSLTKFFSCEYCCKRLQRAGKPRNIRRQVTAKQLATVVVMIMIPQIIIQILALILQPQSLETWFNEDRSVGRQTCSPWENGMDRFWKRIEAYGLMMLILVNMLLLAVARGSQNLPSLFNETQVIFQSTLVNMIVLVLGMSVINLTESPTTSPEVEFLLWVAVVLSITLNSSIRIMWPKLQMVWNNETILVSKLVSDHNEEQRKKQRKKLGRGESKTSKALQNVSGFAATKLKRPSQKRTQPNSENSGVESAGNRESVEEDQQNLQWHSSVASNYDSSAPNVNNDVVSINGAGGGIRGFRGDGKKIIVSLDQTPSRLLVLPMVRMQERLNYMTTRICSGLVVTEESWTEFRELASSMAHQMEDVQFEWEEQETNSNGKKTRPNRSNAVEDFPLLLEKDEEAQDSGKTQQFDYSDGSNVEELRLRQPDDGLPERGSEVDWDDVKFDSP